MNIAIIFGGSSYEHEISIVSAITMKKVLKQANITYLFVDKNREIYLIDKNIINSKLFSSGNYKKSKKVSFKQGALFIDTLLGVKKLDFQIALNLIHGRDGEDGKIPALFEFFNIPLISPSLESSTFAYNKYYTKLFASSIGVKTLDFEYLTKEDKREVKTPYPFIIKPITLGSSIGVSIVKKESELDYALDVAFEFDNGVIIEPFIDGVREFNQAGTFTNEWELSMVEEPNKEEFLDFEKKYMDFSRDSKTQKANISKELEEKLQDSFKKIYMPLFKGSIIRCDFFVIGDEVFLNEINPIPGSMANYLFEDFENMFYKLASNLPKEKKIDIKYEYINTIQSAKGKA